MFYASTGDFLGFVGNVGSRALVRSAIASVRVGAAMPPQGVAAPESIDGIDWADKSSV